VTDTGDNHLQAGITRTSTARIDKMKKDVDEICEHYKDDLNSQRLICQLDVLRDACRGKRLNTVRDVYSCLTAFSSMYDEVFSEVSRLIRLFLVIPVTSATAERSFSAMRRLKTYLRSTMTAERLNAVMVLHTHKDILDQVPDNEAVAEFIACNDRRKKTSLAMQRAIDVAFLRST